MTAGSLTGVTRVHITMTSVFSERIDVEEVYQFSWADRII